MEKTFATLIQSFLHQRQQDKIAAEEKKHAKGLASEGEALMLAQEKWAQAQQKIQTEHQVNTWLTTHANKASQLSMATHVIKFSHSDAKGSSILDNSTLDDPSWVCTANLKHKAIDVTGNAAVLAIAKLFQLELDGVSLLSQFEQGDFSALRPFAKDSSELDFWQQGFSAALTDKQPASHTYAKQLYFPVGDDQYHLLSPLTSSALAQVIDTKVRAARYSEAAVEVRQAKKANQFHEQATEAYLNTAVLCVGGTQTQNVSQLNVGRRGRVLLFSCEPPKWQSQAKPPMGCELVFQHASFRQKTNWAVKRLADQIKTQATANNTVHVRHQQERCIEFLIDQCLDYMSDVHQFEIEQTQWSLDAACRLPLSQRIWLNPSAYSSAVHQENWQQAVAKSFALWLQHRLKQQKVLNEVGSDDSKLFKKPMLDALNLLRLPTSPTVAEISA